MKIGIRREDKNKWEGRIPLIPTDIDELQKQNNLTFVVQPSDIRAFKKNEFEKIGVKVQEDLSECDLIIAVKEMPVDFFQNEKTYLFFSHTIKGRKDNMPILKKIMEKKSTLLDYEKIVDNNNKRIVFFGKYAGLAGMIDSFFAFGQRLKAEGILNPFEKIKYSTDYKDVAEAKKMFAEVAEEIHSGKLSIPVIIGISGYGNVSKGAQEIIDILPTEEITPAKLKTLNKNELSTQKIYKVIFKEKDMVNPIDESVTFELSDYYTNPQKYKSVFSQYLENLDILINAVFWDKQYPKLLTCEYLQNNYKSLKNLRIIGDISCDVNGGIECTKKSTDSGDPFFVYEPENNIIKPGIIGNGPAILAVDNLPAEIGRDSSTFFSSTLKKFIPFLQTENLDVEYSKLSIPDELINSIIIYKGKLTPNYKYLEQYL